MNKAEALLEQLPRMDIAQLRKLWKLHFRSEAGPHLSIQIMRLAVAYKVQEQEYRTSARGAALRKMAERDKRRPEDTGWGYGEKYSPGTRFQREYKGQLHEVLVVDYGRFVYGAEVFRSLSGVVGKITGKRISGTVFFGLRGRDWRDRGP